MKSMFNLDQYESLQSVIINTLTACPFLIQKDGKMSSGLFNYLLQSIMNTDKNTQIHKNHNPKINLQALGQKVKSIYPQFDCVQFQGIFSEKKQVLASKLYTTFSEDGVLDLNFSENLDTVFEGQYLTEQQLRNLMKQMSFPTLTKKQMLILMDGFDLNKDGLFSKTDFLGVIEEVLNNKI